MRGTVFTVMLVVVLAGGCGLVQRGTLPIASRADPLDAIDRDLRRVLGRDDILPIYTPKFSDAERSRLRDDELVLALTINGKSKAYDISTLNAREIVVDQLAGVPILVTW